VVSSAKALLEKPAGQATLAEVRVEADAGVGLGSGDPSHV